MLPALDAAHIRPYAEGGPHEVPDGLLLRWDIHGLFDRGYVTVTPELHFEVSRQIKEEFENGRDYYALHGRTMQVPSKPADRPDRSVLTWHNENRFLGYRITRQDLEPFAFAGLWEFARIGGEDILSTAIIVCDANEGVAPLHDRMSVILEPADYDAWLDPATPARETHALLKPCPAEMLEAYPLSRIVNSPRNDVPECIKAIDDPV